MDKAMKESEKDIKEIEKMPDQNKVKEDLKNEIKERVNAANSDIMHEGLRKYYNDKVERTEIPGLREMKDNLRIMGISMVQDDVEAQIFKANQQNVNF